MVATKKIALAAVIVAAIITACSDSGRIAGPNRSQAIRGAKLNVMGACTTMDNLVGLVTPLFGAGTPNINSVLGKLDNLEKKVVAGDLAGAQAQANNIVRYVRDKAAQGQLLGTQAQVTAFISGVLCYAGLSPDTFLILPSDAPQVRTSGEGTSGVSLEGNTVNEPTLLTLTTLDPNGPSPLITLLDQYPSYVSITTSSAITKAAVVAVCPQGAIDLDVQGRLRLGHQAAGGFEITPPEDASFLTCEVQTASVLPAWVKNLATLFVPKPLYAAVFGGGVGGSVTEFSPFGAVDPELSFAGGGVGGSVTEFNRMLPSNPTPESGRSRPVGPAGKRSVGIAAVPKGRANAVGSTSVAVGASNSTEISPVVNPCAATVGTALSAECRPFITVTTHKGTILSGVSVEWAAAAGSGSIAPNTVATQSCSAFGSTASTVSDELGRASVCWILGPTGGIDSVDAIPGASGEAPAGVTFAPARLRFRATALKITPSAEATGGSFVFNNEAHLGSGSCSNDLNPTLSYSGGSEPTNVGEYILTVTCGEGSEVYSTVTATAGISITRATPVVTVSCPASVVFTGSAQTPCLASATAPGLSVTPTPDYADNTNVGTATASVSLPASGNYGAASGSATFAITPSETITSVVCLPSTVVYTGSPLAPCSATTTGPGDLEAATIISYSDNVNVGTATASASFAGGGNYQASSGSATFDITPATTTTTVSCTASETFTGAALEPCSAGVTGAGALSQALAVSYSGNTNAGTASASAAFAGGGNYLSSTDSETFEILKATTSVSVSCPASVGYTATVQTPCTAAVSGAALSTPIDVTYVAASPRNAGSYTASGAYGGGANWESSSASTTFAVNQQGAAATAGSATINFGAAVPSIPCTVTGLLGPDAGSVTCATSVPAITLAGTYPTTPVVSPTNPLNYSMTLNNGALTVAAYKQVSCFSTPIYSVMPTTKSAQRKGSNLPVKCGLTTPQGAPVTNARGDLVVVDRGINGLGTPVTVFSQTNVFKYSTGGNYAYGLDTSPSNFVAGHQYHVTATWNDGSTTQGWFLLK